MTDVAVAIVGGGPSGLTLAAELARRGAGPILAIEREGRAGGIPRHAKHTGFGLRDLHRLMSGPAYAERLARSARDVGVEVRTNAQVSGWSGDALQVTSPSGRDEVSARAIVLATGCRERPMSARLVAGPRPRGAMTTGMLQQLVYLRGESPGKRALIVGAEHVSYSALLTLAHAGASAALMTTELARHQTFPLLHRLATLRYRLGVRTRTRVVAVHGKPDVEGATLEDLDSGVRTDIACDCVIFTADWIPDHELAVAAGIPLDAGTSGPAVDADCRTERHGVFAVGNVLHGAEPADAAALSGRDAADAVLRHLGGEAWPDTLPVVCEDPLRWVTPNRLGVDQRSAVFLLRSSVPLARPTIEIRHAGRTLWRGTPRALSPGWSTRLRVEWSTSLDPGAGGVRIAVA